jgi:hypothetical protein
VAAFRPAPPGRLPSLSKVARLRVWYGLVVVLLVALRVTVPATRLATAGLVTAASIAAIEYGVRTQHPQRAGAWRCLQAALAVLALGDILFLAVEADATVAVPYPAPHDLVTLLGYLLLSVAVFWLGLPAPPEREETSLIDSISVTLAASLIVWLTVVRPIVESQALGQPGRLTAVFAMLGYLAVLAATVRLVLGWRRNSAVIILATSLVAYLLSESFFGYHFVGSDYSFGYRADLGAFLPAGTA